MKFYHLQWLKIFFYEIVAIFPSESKECYYYPSITKKKNSGGKLVDRYKNVKRRYSSKRTVTTTTPPEGHIESDIRRKLDWLKVSVEPWQQVERFWKETYRQRNHNVHELSGDIIWPYIRHQLGYTLGYTCPQKYYHDHSGNFRED